MGNVYGGKEGRWGWEGGRKERIEVIIKDQGEKIRHHGVIHKEKDIVICALNDICYILRQLSSDSGPFLLPAMVVQWPEHPADLG